jgi:hypothetical protein
MAAVNAQALAAAIADLLRSAGYELHSSRDETTVLVSRGSAQPPTPTEPPDVVYVVSVAEQA